MAWPYHVVADRDDLLALHIPRGSIYKRWARGAAGRELVDDVWRRDVLRLMFPGQHHSIWLFWSDDDERAFSAYYVNMEEPFRRTPLGVDTNDHTLDVMVTPEHEWRWKDAEQMAERVEQGVFSAEFAAAVQAEGERVIEVIERRGSPFSDGWEQWQPDEAVGHAGAARRLEYATGDALGASGVGVRRYRSLAGSQPRSRRQPSC